MKAKLFAIKLNFLVGEFLWKERHHSRMSRAQVASACNISEVQLLDYERGVIAIPFNLLCKLAIFYKVEKTELHYFLETVTSKAQRPWGGKEYSKMILHRQRVL